MSNTDFQARIARLNEKHGAMAEQSQAKPEPGAYPTVASRSSDRAILLELVATPLAFLLGLAVPILAGMFMFHFVSDGGYYEASGAGLLSGLLGDVGIDMMLSGLIAAFFLVKNMWLPLLAQAGGGYIGLWREADLMRMFPEIWGMLYSPEYVAESLFLASRFPQYY